MKSLNNEMKFLLRFCCENIPS